MIRAILTLFASVTLSLALASSATAAVIVPINGSTPAGQSYPDLVANWWQWVLALPDDQNPMTDPTGAHAANGQLGDVFFLAPSLGGDFTRRVTVPQNKYLFFPIVTTLGINAPGETYTEADLRAQLDDFHGRTYLLFAKLDQEQILNVWEYRASSPAGGFQVAVPDGNIFDLPAGTYGPPAIGDGWWLLMEPLSVGRHVLEFRGAVGDPTESDYFQATKYYITVPEPATIALLPFTALLVCRSRRFRTIN
jgi:hypothetical protein